MDEILNALDVTVWADIVAGGVISYCVIGPFFFDRTVTKENYLKLLHDTIIWQLENDTLFEQLQTLQDIIAGCCTTTLWNNF